MNPSTIERCVAALLDKNLTISFAESATAGRLASEFSLIVDSGNVLLGGIVCYNADIKRDVLKVPQALLDDYTPESPEVTRALAHGLSNIFPGDVYVGVTGLASPGGSETEKKPVGTMFIHMLTKSVDTTKQMQFSGTPAQIVTQTVEECCAFLLEELEKTALTPI